MADFREVVHTEKDTVLLMCVVTEMGMIYATCIKKVNLLATLYFLLKLKRIFLRYDLRPDCEENRCSTST
jgi:hypothetical protein